MMRSTVEAAVVVCSVPKTSRPVSADLPSRFGPRHWGQSSARAAGATSRASKTESSIALIDSIGNAHSVATMDAIISDVYSLIGERMVPGILDIADDPETLPGVNGLKVINALRSWDFTCPSGVDGSDSENSPLVADAAELLAALPDLLDGALAKASDSASQRGVGPVQTLAENHCIRANQNSGGDPHGAGIAEYFHSCQGSGFNKRRASDTILSVP